MTTVCRGWVEIFKSVVGESPLKRFYLNFQRLKGGEGVLHPE